MSDSNPSFAFVANGIHHMLHGMFKDAPFEFLLVIAQPGDDDTVQLNTITGIKSADNLRTIAMHLIAMAEGMKTPLDDDNIEGHA